MQANISVFLINELVHLLGLFYLHIWQDNNGCRNYTDNDTKTVLLLLLLLTCQTL